MIKIENTEVFGWEAAIRGLRNPKNRLCDWMLTLPYFKEICVQEGE